MRRRKFRAEQLSRILGEHERGMLVVEGSDWGIDVVGACEFEGCANQAAYNEPYIDVAFSENILAGEWFDENYWASWSAGQFLGALENEGLA